MYLFIVITVRKEFSPSLLLTENSKLFSRGIHISLIPTCIEVYICPLYIRQNRVSGKLLGKYYLLIIFQARFRQKKHTFEYFTFI